MYDNASESFHDHSEFLKRSRYETLFELKPTDYVRWAKGLKKCGYATNPKYAYLLIELIERYDLDQYDEQGLRCRPTGRRLRRPKQHKRSPETKCSKRSRTKN